MDYLHGQSADMPLSCCCHENKWGVWMTVDNEKVLVDPFELADAIREKGIEYFHFPLEEEVRDIGWENIKKAVITLWLYDNTDKHILVHCDGGSHRSRLVVEAFHYAKFGRHLTDEYKGYGNHLIYDCCSGFLPPLEETETVLRNILKQ